MEYFHLNNGYDIPSAGIGTFLLSPDEAEASVRAAIGDGYQLIDTAAAYQNEKAVGRAIKASGKDRKELFVSTKLWPSEYATGEQAIDGCLERLGLDYVDLLFLHQPIGDVKHAYRAMEDAVKAGKVRAIGLSNFPLDELKSLVNEAEIKPSVIQVETHPYYTQKELKQYLSTFGAYVMAWYPLGHGDHALLQEPVFANLAEKYHKTPAQVILRWHIQNGNIVIPGSKNPDHIKANLDLYDFRLTEEEMQEIAAIDREVPYYTATPEALNRYLSLVIDYSKQK